MCVYVCVCERECELCSVGCVCESVRDVLVYVWERGCIQCVLLCVCERECVKCVLLCVCERVSVKCVLSCVSVSVVDEYDLAWVREREEVVHERVCVTRSGQKQSWCRGECECTLLHTYGLRVPTGSDSPIGYAW